MRTSWMTVVCSSIALTLAACAPGYTQGPEAYDATSAPHARPSARLASTTTHVANVATPRAEPLRLVTDHERRLHK